MGSLYDTDIVAWASRQAELIRARKWDALDAENIAEEIEDLGRSEKRELASRMAVLLAHLIKWKYQREKRGKSWLATIKLQRGRVQRKLRQVPSLKHSLQDEEWKQDVWDDALARAHAETGLPDFPEQADWSIDDILRDDFFPD